VARTEGGFENSLLGHLYTCLIRPTVAGLGGICELHCARDRKRSWSLTEGVLLTLAIQIFLDGSGKEETHPVITVGGFIAGEQVCENIEADWEPATGKKIFHLKEFGRDSCELDSHGWTKQEQADFLKRLAAIVNRKGCHIVSTSLEVAPYNALLANSPHAHVNGPAFSACAQACIAIAEFILSKENRQKQKVEYTFEKGDRQHELHKMVSDWDDTHSELNGLRFLAFAPKETTLLQPADLIAGIVQRCLVSAHRALPCLDNGLYSRTALHNYEHHYSSDGVTAAVVSGHDREHCWVVNPLTFKVLDRISTDFFERNPELLEKRLKQSPFKPKPTARGVLKKTTK